MTEYEKANVSGQHEGLAPSDEAWAGKRVRIGDEMAIMAEDLYKVRVQVEHRRPRRSIYDMITSFLTGRSEAPWTDAAERHRSEHDLFRAEIADYVLKLDPHIQALEKSTLEQTVLEEQILDRTLAAFTALDERMGAFNERMARRLEETEHLFRREAQTAEG